MELRTKTAISAALILLTTAIARAETFTVRHQHFHGGRVGTLEIGDTSISFKEEEKKPAHSREWKYQDIQQLTLSPTKLRILTYEDQKWKLGLDREYVFNKLPQDFVAQAYSSFREKLDQRFVADIPAPQIAELWRIPVKLQHWPSGSEGILTVGEDRVVYNTEKGESHTWRYQDIDNVSSSGPFDLSMTTMERSPRFHTSPTQYQFQLKEFLTEERYNDLWRRLNRSKGLQILR